MKRIRSEIAAMGYKYQFTTLAGFHDAVAPALSAGACSTTAMAGSTEAHQL